MHISKTIIRILGGTLASVLLLASCAQKPKLKISMSDKFEGETVELVNFLDSTVLATAVINNGEAEITLPADSVMFTALLIDGRTRAFYITEPGTALVNDSTNSATGTPLNDQFDRLLVRLDSIEDTDDMDAYRDFAREQYNANRNNVLASYFGIEWLRYADINTADSLLAVTAPAIRDSKKARHYRDFAELRSRTAPGSRYVDVNGETANGKPLSLSRLVNKQGFTLVDFWASWCPYCIKEIPDMKALADKWDNGRLAIVGIAVRDIPGDTQASVAKHEIAWPVIYNTQRRPYDIYGFSGIPHHMLIDKDGVIVSRGETAAQIDARLEEFYNPSAE